MTSKAKRLEQETGRKEIDRLFAMAKEKATGTTGASGTVKERARENALANRYVTIARKLSSKARVSLRRYNRVHCRKCCTYFTSTTLRVRSRARPQPTMVYTCLSCGDITRIPKRAITARNEQENKKENKRMIA